MAEIPKDKLAKNWIELPFKEVRNALLKYFKRQHELELTVSKIAETMKKVEKKVFTKNIRDKKKKELKRKNPVRGI